jgi:hypothetical protein
MAVTNLGSGRELLILSTQDSAPLQIDEFLTVPVSEAHCNLAVLDEIASHSTSTPET